MLDILETYLLSLMVVLILEVWYFNRIWQFLRHCLSLLNSNCIESIYSTEFVDLQARNITLVCKFFTRVIGILRLVLFCLMLLTSLTFQSDSFDFLTLSWLALFKIDFEFSRILHAA